jgi:uncharacterized membrane protein YqjE
MLGASELDATVGVLLLLEAGFVAWLIARARRERSVSRTSFGLVDDAERLGLRARRRRA